MAPVIGIDVGGSKTHGVRSDGDRVLAEAFGPSANIASVGVQEATAELHALLDELGPDDVHAICVGTAGGDLAERQLLAVLQLRFPAVPVQVVHDTQLILAAAGLEHGVVVVSGTGSAAWGRSREGGQARAGGWGYLLGDDGSAYGVVRAALRHVLDRSDAGDPPDPLTDELLRSCATTTTRELLDVFYRSPSRRRWARESTVVFRLAEAGDAAARAIVTDAAAELVRAATHVCRRIASAGPVVLAGGLAVHQPLLQQAVGAGLAAAGVADVRVLRGDPVQGAVALALGSVTGGATPAGVAP